MGEARDFAQSRILITLVSNGFDRIDIAVMYTPDIVTAGEKT